jgi:hypothetical protein
MAPSPKNVSAPVVLSYAAIFPFDCFPVHSRARRCDQPDKFQLLFVRTRADQCWTFHADGQIQSCNLLNCQTDDLNAYDWTEII